MSTDETNEIMHAVDADALFGCIEKRAKLKYRRLMRAVHPDVDPSPEAKDAATRLNELWEDWKNEHNGTDANEDSGAVKERTKAKHGGKTILKTESIALVRSDCWLSVYRTPNTGTEPSSIVMSAIKDASRLSNGSPVFIPGSIETIVISQRDGNHIAMKTGFGRMDTGWALDSFGVLNPRDVAWILKRMLFLTGILVRVGLYVPELGSRIIVKPSEHIAGLVSFNDAKEIDSTGDDAVDMVTSVASEMAKHVDMGTTEGRRLVSFARGCANASALEDMGDIMREYDGMSRSLFGSLKYHPMSDPE